VQASGDEGVRRVNPGVLVIDDPSPVAAGRWVRRARRLGVAIATIHDGGIGAVDSDLVIDGSVAPGRGANGKFGSLRGPAYAVLDPRLRAARARYPRAAGRRVLIALGGGAHAHRLVPLIAEAISERVPNAEIEAAGGFTGPRARPAFDHGRWIDATDGLADELSSAALAIVGGGMTVYEACALGIPAIGIAVTAGQRRAIEAMARRGAIVNGGTAARLRHTAVRVGRESQRVLDDPAARRRLRLTGRRLVDARGAFRIAARLRQLRLAFAAASAAGAALSRIDTTARGGALHSAPDKRRRVRGGGTNGVDDVA
jgi:hypothetical protein